MAFRSVSKGGAKCALTRPTLLAPLMAVLMSTGVPTGAVVLSAEGRIGDGAMVASGTDARFEGVGRIECLDPVSRSMTYLATGWVLGGADTVMTAAHVFFRDGAGSVSTARVLDPGKCNFVLYDRDEKVRESAHIRYALSPWSEPRFRNDSSYDVAVLKLDRLLKVANIPSVRVSAATDLRSVDLVAFHTGLVHMQHAWVTRGRRDAFPASQLRYDRAEMRITSAPRLFSTSADSSAGSSGGMYYDERLDAAVGLHIGTVCDQIRPSYDRKTCFNFGLRFDAAIVALVDAVVRDRPQPIRLVRFDGGTARLALAPPLVLALARIPAG